MNQTFRALGACVLLTIAPTAFAASVLPAGHLSGQRVQLVQAGEKVFPAVGVVTAREANGALTINHQNIVGLMDAMEMTFNVKPRTLSAAVRPGDTVEFSVEGKTFTIVALKVVGHEK